MEQNNFNGQGMNPATNEMQQPAYNNQAQNGYYNQNMAYNNQVNNPYAPAQQNGYQQNPYQQNTYQQNAYQQNQQIDGSSIPAIATLVDGAFARNLAATIMGWFPIASIIAIVLSFKGLNMVKEANALAANYGVEAGGKNVAAKVLGIIGKIVGIVYTCIWGIYFIILFMAIILSAM